MPVVAAEELGQVLEMQPVAPEEEVQEVRRTEA